MSEKNIILKKEKKNKNDKPLSSDQLRKINAYWRAANYLSADQIYLYDNPLLKKPLKLEHVKPRLLGHFGVNLNNIFKIYCLVTVVEI